VDTASVVPLLPSVTDTSLMVKLATPVLAVEELFPGVGSVVVVLTLAEFVIVTLAGLELIFTTNEKLAVAPLASDEMVAVTLPVPQTAGVDGVQPPDAPKDTKVVLAGTASVSWTLAASLGPLFATVIE